MAANEPRSEKNLDGYGAPIIPWSKVRARLEQGLTQSPGAGGPNRHTTWLATVAPDGHPHVMPLGALWIDGRFYFTSGPGTQKSKNLAQNPRCTVCVATEPFDLVVEGEAHRVTDEATLKRTAGAYQSVGWPAKVQGGALVAEYSAPSAGPPPWYVYEVRPQTVYAMGAAEPGGATRWRF